MASTARLLCANTGHKWSDGNYFQEKAGPKLGVRHVWVLRIVCERDGCDRGRIDRVMPKTYQLISRQYTGSLEKIGRVTREELRAELVKRRV